ncbi:MAG: hypothetical protein WEF50_10650 [Myxococcota bacterium]
MDPSDAVPPTHPESGDGTPAPASSREHVPRLAAALRDGLTEIAAGLERGLVGRAPKQNPSSRLEWLARLLIIPLVIAAGTWFLDFRAENRLEQVKHELTLSQELYRSQLVVAVDLYREVSAMTRLVESAVRARGPATREELRTGIRRLDAKFHESDFFLMEGTAAAATRATGSLQRLMQELEGENLPEVQRLAKAWRSESRDLQNELRREVRDPLGDGG